MILVLMDTYMYKQCMIMKLKQKSIHYNFDKGLPFLSKYLINFYLVSITRMFSHTHYNYYNTMCGPILRAKPLPQG
jgi:hypothetical protein